MAREEKVWEYAMDAGFTPLEDRCIIVKGAAGDLSEKIVRFFETWDMAVLQMCENELILLPFESFWGTLERDVSLVIPYADIESVKLIDDLLNVVIRRLQELARRERKANPASPQRARVQGVVRIGLPPLTLSVVEQRR